jgi:hypothetical protein
VDEEDDLRAGLGEPPLEVGGLRNLRPLVRQLVDVAAVGGRELRPALAEVACRDGEDALAGREEVDDGRLEGAGARRRADQHVVLGSIHLAQASQHAREELLEVGAAVVDDGLASGREHLRRHRSRARGQQIPLPRHPPQPTCVLSEVDGRRT